MIACELFHSQDYDAVQHEKHTVAQCCPQPRARSAKRLDPTCAVHKDIVENDVDRDRCHRDIHGETRPSVCIDEVAQNNRRCNGDESKCNIGEVLHCNSLDHRLKCKGTHEMRNGKHTDEEHERGKKRRPVETLLNDAPNLPCAARTIMLGDDGRQPRNEPHKSPKHRKEDTRPNGDAREILLADMPRHDRIEKARRHKRYLCDKDREENDNKLAHTRRIAVNLLQILPPSLRNH